MAVKGPVIKFELIRSDLRLPARRAIRAQLKGALNGTGAEGKRFIAEYPAQVLTRSGYVRTGTLKRSWSFELTVTAKEMSVVVGSNRNIAPYNEDVQGQDQLSLFAGAGWRNIEDLADVMRSELEGRARTAMEQAFKMRP